jgi:hypothetical protein
MKSIYKKLHFVLAALFVVGVLYSGLVLYNLPAELEKVSGKIDLNAINEAQPVFAEAYTVIGLTLIVGFVVVLQFLYILNNERKAAVQVKAGSDDFGKSQETQVVGDEENDSISEIVKEIRLSAKDLKDEKSRYEKILSKICMRIEASQGIYYSVKKDKSKRYIEMLTSFAYSLPESETLTYEFGEGLAGQVAKEGKKINIDSVPDGYIKIISGLGSASPNNLLIYPVKDGEAVTAIVEIASFREITKDDEKLIAEALKGDSVKSKSAREEQPASKEKTEDKKAGEKK